MRSFLKNILKDFFYKNNYIIKKRNPFNDHLERLKIVLNNVKIDGVIDVGANKGQFLKQNIEVLKEFPTLIIEPLKIHNKQLKFLKYKNILEILNVCIGTKSDEVEINVSENDVCSSILELDKNSETEVPTARYVNKLKVKCERLDYLIENYFSSSDSLFIKVDVQGVEDDVLSSIGTLIEKVSFIYIELSFVKLYKNQKLWREIADHKILKDFSIVDVNVIGASPSYGIATQADMLFMRNKLNKLL
tara:strand:- start:8326 stop:9066 length:741 start_codon:yes stop_codon:yes gene_type:complete